MLKKRLTSVVVASLMAVSMLFTPLMNMPVYAAEESAEVITTDIDLSADSDGEIIEEEQNDEGTPEAVLTESDSTDAQEDEEQGTDALEEDELRNDGQDEADASTTSAEAEDETDPSDDLPEESTEDADDVSQNIDDPDQTVDPVTEEAATMEAENEAVEDGLEDQNAYVCGDNLQWNYNGTDTITISGTGSMYDYFQGDSPFSYISNVDKVVIESGVTSIGQNAFYGMSTVETVNIPDSIMQIGQDAFTMCDSLADIYYAGTLNEWSNIEGGDFCDDLSVIIHATDGVSGSNGQLPIGECVIDELSAMTYTGEELTQTFSIRNGDKVLIPNTDYTVEYANNINAGIATVTITGQGAYTGSVEKTFTIAPKNVTPTIVLDNKTLSYTGNNQKPSVTVKIGDTILTLDQDYTVRYATNCSNVGTYNAVVTLKGNYSGSKKASYTINPKATPIYNVVGSNNQFDVRWTKQTTEVTGYQIQYSLSSSFDSGTKTVTITDYNVNKKTIKKPVAGKNYYVRVRTYKTAKGTRYYSSWSKTVYSIVRKNLSNKKTIKLSNEVVTDLPQTYSFNFALSNRMIAMVPVKIEIIGPSIPSGGLRITLKDSKGKVWQNDFINLKSYGYGDIYEGWFYSDGGLLPPGDYTYVFTCTAEDDIKLTFSAAAYTKKAVAASINKNCSTSSGNWIKIGKISDGLPLVKSVTYTGTNIIDGWDIESDGSVWLWAEKKGTSDVTVTLTNGTKYKTRVNVSAGNPNFTARITGYNTRDNYFTVKIKNHRRSDLVIIRSGGKVENVDYKSFDRWIKGDGNVTIKYGETKTVKFYLKGSTTWPLYSDYTLFAKFTFEGKTYEWHVWDEDSVFKIGTKWYNTYWDGNFE